MKNKNDWDISFKTLRFPLLFILIFVGIGIWRYVATGSGFYLLNFGYIGTAVAVGSFLSDALPRKHAQWGRRIAQILVASYMLGFLGFVGRENMQIEGFFFYSLMGIFGGATLHYFVAKIAGTFLFNRGWCGWACWTAMVLDLLPWKKPRSGRLRRLGVIRYIHFALSLGLVLFIWYIQRGRKQFVIRTELYWLAVGNALYYVVGIALAATLKDNRAFCKYICPIPVLQKVGARFAIMRTKINPDKCTECGLCEKHCPMDIKLLDYNKAGQRILSTECILCNTCANVCPVSAINSNTSRFDITRKEHLRYKTE